jgi:hypothetical protein
LRFADIKRTDEKNLERYFSLHNAIEVHDQVEDIKYKVQQLYDRHKTSLESGAKPFIFYCPILLY